METYAIFSDSFFSKKPWWMPGKLYRVVHQRSNPRTKEYMINLLAEKCPEAKLVDIEQLPREVERLILLYPDSIGLGWRGLERKFQVHSSKIRVLTGRKQYFPLTAFVHRKLRIKRLLEKTFLPEILFAPILLLLGIILALKDKLRGCS